MESLPIKTLRRSVRAAVRCALQRRTRDHDLDESDLAEILALAGDGVPETTVQQWVRQDESDFDQANLISELVAARLSRAGAAPGVATPAFASSHANQAERSRQPAPDTAPDVADLLDQMFSQQTAPPSART